MTYNIPPKNYKHNDELESVDVQIDPESLGYNKNDEDLGIFSKTINMGSASGSMNNIYSTHISSITAQSISQLPINSAATNTGAYYTSPGVYVNDGFTYDTYKNYNDVHIQGELYVQGKNLSATLETIEERLAILKPNPELEERWETLKSLRKQYMDLEKEILEKEEIWKTLKK